MIFGHTCNMSTPKTLQQAIIHFSSFENCKDFMVRLRWPNGVVKCPHCGSEKVTWLEKARMWKCYQKHPRPKFTLKTGTIFEDSPLGLDKWLPAVWLIVNAKNGISSWELHRALGVTQKTAWFMLHRIRLAMQDDLTGGSLGGEVEVDETFIGGKARNMHKERKARVQKEGRNTGGKSVVLGMLERGGRVRATVIPDRTKKSIQSIVAGSVEPGSKIMADEHGEQWKMADYETSIIQHLSAYVDGNVHTNGIENFWSLLKRGIGGTYVSVEPFHLFRYVDEQVYRFNNRDMKDEHRFKFALRHIVGRRVTYSELTGKDEDPRSAAESQTAEAGA
jgi:transposase-like protein